MISTTCAPDAKPFVSLSEMNPFASVALGVFDARTESGHCSLDGGQPEPLAGPCEAGSMTRLGGVSDAALQAIFYGIALIGKD